MMHFTFFADTVTELIYSASGLVLQIGIGIGIIFIIRAAVETVSFLGKISTRVGGATKGVTDAARDRVSRGRNLRKQAKDQYRNRQFLDRAASGKGVRGRMFRAASRVGMGSGAREEMMENLIGQQEKLREQRLSTLRTSVRRAGGSRLTPHLAAMNAGESAGAYQARLRKAGVDRGDKKLVDAADGLDTEALDEIATRFRGQVGSSEFRIAALQAAHDAGGDIRPVSFATEAVARQLQSEATGTAEQKISKANNIMIDTVAPTAKSGGFTGMGYAGLDANGDYSDYAIKLGADPVTGVPRTVAAGDSLTAARGVVKSMSFEGMETGQLSLDGTLTDLGQALLLDAKDAKVAGVTAQRIGAALRQPKAKHRDELMQIVTAAGPAFKAEVDRIVAGKT